MITSKERLHVFIALSPDMMRDAMAHLLYADPAVFDAAIVWAMAEETRRARAAADMLPTTKEGSMDARSVPQLCDGCLFGYPCSCDV